MAIIGHPVDIFTYDSDGYPVALVGPAGNVAPMLKGVYDSAGNVVGIDGPTSDALNLASLQPALRGGPLIGKQFSNLLSILPTNDISLWNDLAGAGVTATLDTAVTFNGSPSIRLDIPANFAGGTCRIGTTGATCRIPYTYDKTNMAWAVKSSNLVAVDGPLPYLGDSTFANFFQIGGGQTSSNQPQMQYANNDWMVFKPAATDFAVGAGTPAIATLMRLRVNFTVANVGTATQVWIGFIGIMPKRPKPTVILSPDDGFASWQTFLLPMLKHYRIPASLACTSSLVGGGNYWTQAQLIATANDPSGLFEIINHNRIHNNYTQYANAAAYFADVQVCNAYLRSIGLTGKSIMHHAYPNSLWSDGVLALLSSGGYLTARASTASTNGEYQDQMIFAGDKLRWKLNIIASLQTGVSVANVITAVTTLKTSGGVGWINCHDFAAADAAFVYSYDNMTQVCGYLASERNAGNIELMRWSDWYDTYCTQ